MSFRVLVAALVALGAVGLIAAAPPSVAPSYTRDVSLQPVAVYDAAGNVVSTLGGAPPSSAYSVVRTGAIGTAAVLVSAADTTNRRTVTNTGTQACELVQAAGAFGSGYPIPAGASFTFDANGRTTAALYIACASAGGTVAVLSY